MDGSLETIDGRPALRFQRSLNHSVERVWRAVTEPAELARWFVAPVEWKPELGERLDAMGQPGEITELEPPRLIVWTWATQRFGFELRPDGDGCLLVFTHVIDDRAEAAQHAAGWETYFKRLDAHLAGGYLSEEEAHHDIGELHEAYAAAFDLDPEVGRAAIADMRAQRG